MKSKHTLLIATLAGAPAAHAGMTAPRLTDLAGARLDAISFFIVVYLLCALVFRWVWNVLARDFAWMPRLSFTRSLALLVVAGLFMYFILTMISGARELLTPGAWMRNGVGYKLADPAQQKGDEFLQAARRRTIERLREALLAHAEKHEGKLPAHIFAPDFDRGLWKGLSPDGAWFGFVNGRRFEAPAMVIAYEPAAHGARRWVLLSDTSLVEMDSAELEERLKKEATP